MASRHSIAGWKKETKRAAEGRGTLDPNRKLRKKMRGKKTPEKPEKTAEQLALERRQQVQLDKETAENERRLKQMARGKLGAESLLSGTEPTQERLATRKGGGAGAGGISLLGAAASTAARAASTPKPAARTPGVSRK